MTITKAVTTLSFRCSNCREWTTPPLKPDSGPVLISFSISVSFCPSSLPPMCSTCLISSVTQKGESFANFKASSVPRAEQASKEWIDHEYLPHGSPFYFCYSKINLKHSPSLTTLAPKLNYCSDPIHYLTHWLYIWSHFALFFPSAFCSTSIELILFPGIHTVSCLYGCTQDIFFPRMAYSLFLV